MQKVSRAFGTALSHKISKENLFVVKPSKKVLKSGWGLGWGEFLSAFFCKNCPFFVNVERCPNID